MESRARRFRTVLGDVARDLVLGERVVTVDGSDYEYSLERLSEGNYHLLLNGRSYTVFATYVGDGRYRITVNGKTAEIVVKTERELLLEQYGLEQGAGGADKSVRAPMPGLVLSTLVSRGDVVRRGDGLLVLEAMKMENEIRSTTDGTVKDIFVEAGDAVGKDAVLIELE